MNASTVVILVLFALSLLVFLFGFSVKADFRRQAKETDLKEEIMSLFLPGERLTGIQVRNLLKVKTEGRLDIPVVEVFEMLDALVEHKKLRSDASDVELYSGFRRVEYFLPE
jgi:hypothetical protein